MGSAMNNAQRILIATYIPMTAVVIFAGNAYPGSDTLRYIKYAAIVAIFLSAMVVRKKYPEQRMMTLALFFITVADYFLVFSIDAASAGFDRGVVGGIGFILAYLCLIAVYQRNLRLGRREILCAITVAVLFLSTLSTLAPYVEGTMLIGVALFGVTLSYMLWSAICTIFSNYYNAKPSLLMAVSGILMSICDIGVAYSRFYPEYLSGVSPWLENMIWVSYIPGWMLIAVIICEVNLIRG